MTIKDLNLAEDIGKRIKIIGSKNKKLIGHKGSLSNAFTSSRRVGLFLDNPLSNGQDEIDLTQEIIFEFTLEVF